MTSAWCTSRSTIAVTATASPKISGHAEKSLVGRDDQNGSLVAGADKSDEQRRGLRIEGDVSNLVADHERDPPHTLELVVKRGWRVWLGRGEAPIHGRWRTRLGGPAVRPGRPRRSTDASFQSRVGPRTRRCWPRRGSRGAARRPPTAAPSVGRGQDDVGRNVAAPMAGDLGPVEIDDEFAATTARPRPCAPPGAAAPNSRRFDSDEAVLGTRTSR